MTANDGEDCLTIEYVVHSIVACLAPDREADVTRSSDLRDDLGYHSLALVELAFLIEDAFTLDPIPREEAELVRLVGEITEYVEGKTKLRGFVFEDEPRVVALLEDLASWEDDF